MPFTDTCLRETPAVDGRCEEEEEGGGGEGGEEGGGEGGGEGEEGEVRPRPSILASHACPSVSAPAQVVTGCFLPRARRLERT
jgi:hypothetical protein